MAKILSESLLEYLDGPSEDYGADYKVWANKEEWKLVGKIRSRIQEMYNARQNTCYLINYDGSKSWDAHWNLLEKDYLMYSEFGNEDDWRSNLKSSIAYRTISSLDSKERKQEVDFMVEASNESDESKGRAIVYRYMYEDYFRRNPEIRYKFLEISKRAKIFGTSIAYVPYTIKMRKVSMPEVTDVSKKDIKSGELPEIEYKDKFIVDYEDADLLPWNIQDFYVDPNARSIHGTDHPATDVAGILYVTESQVRMMFQGDPAVKNLDKIKSNNNQSYSSPFFSPPRDTERGYGELVYYYNVETDSEVIMYGDVLLKEGPIPYQDKKIPFVDFRFIKHPGHFYGMGVGDITIQQSSEESALKNSRLDRVKFTTTPPTFVGATIFGDVDDQWDTMEPNMLVKVGDVSQVKPLEFPPIPFDSFRISEELKDEAVMNTGINPHGMSLPMSSTPATNTIAMKETASDMANMYADNLMEGMGHWGQLLGSRFSQFYSTPSRKSSLEYDKKEMRKLRLEDIDLYKDDDGNYNYREVKGSKIIPLEKEMFNWDGEPRIYVNPDFIAPLSGTYRMRKAQEVLPQLVQLAGDRGMPMANGAPAVIDIRKLVRWFLEEMEMSDQDLILDEDEDRIEEIKEAQEQQLKMQDGEQVAGIPGEPLAHRYTHAVELRRLNDAIGSEDYQLIVQSPDPQMQAFVIAMDEYRKQLTEHLRLDNLLQQDAPEASVADSDAVSQAVSGGMEGGMPMPRNNAVNIPTVSGNQGLPNQGGMPVPNKMGVEDVTGQIAGTAI